MQSATTVYSFQHTGVAGKEVLETTTCVNAEKMPPAASPEASIISEVTYLILTKGLPTI